MSDTTQSAHPESEEWLTTYEQLGIAEEQLAASQQENERLRVSLVEATRGRHMCRMGHRKVLWSGDGECPVCEAIYSPERADA